MTKTATDIVNNRPFHGSAISFARNETKEVVIRRHRDLCCAELALGLLPMMLFVQSIRDHELDKRLIPIDRVLAELRRIG